MPLAIRFAVAALAALTIAAVPIYPGATLDVAASKAESAAHPKYPYKVYVTPDSYEKVVAFYKSKGAAQSNAVSVGNSAQQKNGHVLRERQHDRDQLARGREGQEREGDLANRHQDRHRELTASRRRTRRRRSQRPLSECSRVSSFCAGS